MLLKHIDPFDIYIYITYRLHTNTAHTFSLFSLRRLGIIIATFMLSQALLLLLLRLLYTIYILFNIVIMRYFRFLRLTDRRVFYFLQKLLRSHY